MKKYLKIFFASLCVIVIVGISSIVYGFIKHRSFTLRYIFDANFFAGIFLMVVAIVVMFLPSILFPKDNTSLDRFTPVERDLDSREKRHQIARMILWLGLFITILAGLIQLLLARLI